MTQVSKAVAAKKLDDFGLGKEEETPKAPRESYGRFDFPEAAPRNSYAAAKGRTDDADVPAFLKKGSLGSARSSTTPDAGPTRKHGAERTAPHAPHSYIRSEEKFKVSETLSLPEAAQFSEAAAKFITNRVHEAMADAMQKYGLIWTSHVSLAMKDHIRDSFEGCTYAKVSESGDRSYVAVRVGENEIDG